MDNSRKRLLIFPTGLAILLGILTVRLWSYQIPNRGHAPVLAKRSSGIGAKLRHALSRLKHELTR